MRGGIPERETACRDDAPSAFNSLERLIEQNKDRYYERRGKKEGNICSDV
jgi:hypothetical protein